jgi:hypothetical protein
VIHGHTRFDTLMVYDDNRRDDAGAIAASSATTIELSRASGFWLLPGTLRGFFLLHFGKRRPQYLCHEITLRHALESRDDPSGFNHVQGQLDGQCFRFFLAHRTPTKRMIIHAARW